MHRDESEGDGGPARVPAPPGPGLERRGSGRRSVYVPLRRRAARFLDALGACGNVTLAAETAGIGRDRIYRLRREDGAFAEEWERARAAFAARAEAEDGIDLAGIEADGLTVRRGRDGQVQIAAAHPLAWTARREEAFFAAYRASGNVSAAARAAGFSAKAAWERARKAPDFARRLAEEKDAATERLDFYLIEHGTNLLLGEEGAKPDPHLAMWLLKRADQERAGRLRRGSAATARAASAEEVVAALEVRLKAFRRRRESEKLEAGWTRTEAGEWVGPEPPEPPEP